MGFLHELLLLKEILKIQIFQASPHVVNYVSGLI